MRVPIPGTRMVLTVEAEDLQTPEVQAWLEEVAQAIGPAAAKAIGDLAAQEAALWAGLSTYIEPTP